jgi:uncharacterized protein YueI
MIIIFHEEGPTNTLIILHSTVAIDSNRIKIDLDKRSGKVSKEKHQFLIRKWTVLFTDRKS